MPLRQHQEVLEVRTPGLGLHEITARVAKSIAVLGFAQGVAHITCMHTSCSLAIQENADPSARHDMESWLAKIAPENDPDYTHTAEGPDDMPAHLRALVTRTTETIPIRNGRLLLGTWQGLYLCEHRRRPHTRRLVLHVTGE